MFYSFRIQQILSTSSFFCTTKYVNNKQKNTKRFKIVTMLYNGGFSNIKYFYYGTVSTVA
jgi:hypothetical protein